MPDDSASRLLTTAPAKAAHNAVLPKTPLPFVWRYLTTGFLGSIALMTVMMAAAASVETAQTYVFGALVNELAGIAAIVWGKRADPVVWFAALCVTWLLGYALNHLYSLYTLRTQLAMRVRIQADLFDYLLDHAPRYFLDHASGALAQRIRQAAVSAAAIVEYLLANAVRFAVMLSITAVVILRHVPNFAPIYGVFLVVLIAVSWIMAQRMRAYAKISAKASSELVARLVDAVSNWDIVRSFARGLFERKTFAPYNDAEFDAVLRLRFVATIMRVLLHVLSVAFLAWLSWNALDATRASRMNVGMFTMIVSLSLLLAGHIRTLGDSFFAYFEHYGIVSEALGVILEPHEIVDPPGARPLRVTGGGITIRDVTFGYHDGTPVFDRFSLEVAPGERVGLVGSSGAGKSTLVRLMRRQFTVGRGDILIDGQDIAGVTWDSLHEAIAEVPQTPGMFHRTVRDNIRYSRPDADEAAVVAAAKLAHCHEFVAARPKGYDSVVGEKGMKLSGGERQRIAIARAFLKNAPILILDEATSSLDSEAEHLIQEGLLKLMEGRTVIAIAHRLSTIMSLDRIVVLDQGRIAEQGTHAELLARGGIYARLWNRQAGGFL